MENSKNIITTASRIEEIKKLFEAVKSEKTKKGKQEKQEEATGKAIAFNMEAYANAMKNASVTEVINTLLPALPKKQENIEKGFTYQKENGKTFNYSMFSDVEKGTVKTYKVKFVEYFIANMGIESYKILFNDIIVKYDKCIASLKDNDTIEGVNDLKEAINALIKSLDLGIANGLTVNKSLIRLTLKTASNVNNKGNVASYAYNMEKARQEVRKAERMNENREEALKKAKEKLHRIEERFAKHILSIVAKTIILKARNINNITILSPDDLKAIEEEVKRAS